jgi:transposase
MRAGLDEIAALKKEVVRLRAERDILKRAAVGSTRQRNGSLEGTSQRLETKRFSWPCIEPEGNLIKVILSVDG